MDLEENLKLAPECKGMAAAAGLGSTSLPLQDTMQFPCDFGSCTSKYDFFSDKLYCYRDFNVITDSNWMFVEKKTSEMYCYVIAKLPHSILIALKNLDNREKVCLLYGVFKT
ncbi:hypothetical protein VNO77_01500 [Canavalia gladiata]|uniref:Uncharacterized protein n=1 Tax=Canavalia gladiata TaxID=3824 RepID=A0AAN9R6C5_CANGL